MEYTKGEWVLGSNNDITANGHLVAHLYGTTKQQVIANAHLIAAAPALYEACKKAKSALWLGIVLMPDCPIKTQCDEAYRQMLEALVEAEGK